MLQQIFGAEDVSALRTAAGAAGVSTKAFEQFLAWVAAFYGNMGNYLSFGDTKIIPELDYASFATIIRSSQAYKTSALARKIWADCGVKIYSLTPRVKELSLGDGMSTYYSSNCTKADAEIVQGFLDQEGISAYNTRLFKRDDGDSVRYEVRLAAAKRRVLPPVAYNGVAIQLVYGDYQPIMQDVVDELTRAVAFAANGEQEAMLKKYIEAFGEGSTKAHVEGSRAWIKDKGGWVNGAF